MKALLLILIGTFSAPQPSAESHCDLQTYEVFSRADFSQPNLLNYHGTIQARSLEEARKLVEERNLGAWPELQRDQSGPLPLIQPGPGTPTYGY